MPLLHQLEVDNPPWDSPWPMRVGLVSVCFGDPFQRCPFCSLSRVSQIWEPGTQEEGVGLRL